MTAPVAYSLVGSIFQRHITTSHRHHAGPQHLHLLYIDMLALHVCGTHIYHTLHVHQGTDSSRGHTMLSSTSLSDDACLAHVASQ